MWTEQKQRFVDASAKAFIEVMPLSLMTAKMRAAELLGAIEAKNESGLTTLIAMSPHRSSEQFPQTFATAATRAFLGLVHNDKALQFDVRRSDGALYPFAIPSRRFM